MATRPGSAARAGRPAAGRDLAAALDWPCLRATPEGCQLDVSVVPNARRTAADGFHDGALRVRLAAPPVDGKANAQLVAWLADALGCARRDVALLRGDTARRKQLAIGLPAAAVAAWLARVTEGDGDQGPGRQGQP